MSINSTINARAEAMKDIVVHGRNVVVILEQATKTVPYAIVVIDSLSVSDMKRRKARLLTALNAAGLSISFVTKRFLVKEETYKTFPYGTLAVHKTYSNTTIIGFLKEEDYNMFNLLGLNPLGLKTIIVPRNYKMAK